MGSRPLRPQAMTGRVRYQGLGPRSAGRTRPSSSRGAWVRERHRVDFRGDLPSSLGARFFLNECMQICVSGFSWHLSFGSSTRSGEFPIIIINRCSIRTRSVLFERIVVARRLAVHSLFPVQAVHLSTLNRGVLTTFSFFLTFSESWFLNLRLGLCIKRTQASYRM